MAIVRKRQDKANRNGKSNGFPPCFDTTCLQHKNDYCSCLNTLLVLTESRDSNFCIRHPVQPHFQNLQYTERGICPWFQQRGLLWGKGKANFLFATHFARAKDVYGGRCRNLEQKFCRSAYQESACEKHPLPIVSNMKWSVDPRTESRRKLLFIVFFYIKGVFCSIRFVPKRRRMACHSR